MHDAAIRSSERHRTGRNGAQLALQKSFVRNALYAGVNYAWTGETKVLQSFMMANPQDRRHRLGAEVPFHFKTTPDAGVPLAVACVIPNRETGGTHE